MNYIISIAITFILGVISGVFIIPRIRGLYVERCRPLEIKPTNKIISVSKNGDNWNEEFFVYLINNSESPYYDINIVSEFPKDIDLSMLPEKFNTVSLGGKENGVSVGLDFMLGLENKKGMGVAQTVINNIGPNEKNKIKVIINKKGYKKDFNLKFKITNFNKIPKPVFKK